MGSDKNTPSEENTPEDTSPKEHDALDRKSSIENHSEQKKRSLRAQVVLGLLASNVPAALGDRSLKVNGSAMLGCRSS